MRSEEDEVTRGRRKRVPVKRFEDEEYPAQSRRKTQNVHSNDSSMNEENGRGGGDSRFLEESPEKSISVPTSVPMSFPGISQVPARRRADPAYQRASRDVKKCNCKNSRCLKLYCECFASGRYCDGCNCNNCHNNRDHESLRQTAVVAILDRNPNAFRPKVAIEEDEEVGSVKHHKGCNCKKSWCLKKYCECFQAGVLCSESCRCVGCKNYAGSPYKTGPQVHEHEAYVAAMTSPDGLGFGGKQKPSPGVIHSPIQSAPRQTQLGSPLQLSPEKLRVSSSKAALVNASLTPEQIKSITDMCVNEVIKPEVIEQVCTLLMLLVDENLEKIQNSNPRLKSIFHNEAGMSSFLPEQIDASVQDIEEKSEELKSTIDSEFLSTMEKIIRVVKEKIEEKKKVFQMHQNTLFNSFLAQSGGSQMFGLQSPRVPAMAAPMSPSGQNKMAMYAALQQALLHSQQQMKKQQGFQDK